MNGSFGSNGTLEVDLTHAEGRLRLQGARVEVMGESGFQITDNEGVSRFVLPAPLPIYSLTPGSPVRPYSTYDIRITLAGYVPLLVTGIQIFPHITTILRRPRTNRPKGNPLTACSCPRKHYRTSGNARFRRHQRYRPLYRLHKKRCFK